MGRLAYKCGEGVFFLGWFLSWEDVKLNPFAFGTFRGFWFPSLSVDDFKFCFRLNQLSTERKIISYFGGFSMRCPDAGVGKD